MRLRVLQAIFILFLVRGMGLADTVWAQIAPGAAPESQDHVTAPSTPTVDLSQENVLVLHAFESNVPLFELTDRRLRTALDAGGVGIRNQFFEYLDLARNPGPEHRQHLTELLRSRYSRYKFGVIITMLPEALRFVLEENRAIFPDAPINYKKKIQIKFIFRKTGEEDSEMPVGRPSTRVCFCTVGNGIVFLRRPQGRDMVIGFHEPE